MKILLIEDDVSVNKMITTILKDEGHEVYTSFDGVEGLKLIQKEPDINLVITDIIMPEKEGIETIREIRKKYPLKKIIAISGGGKIDAGSYLKLAQSLGANYIMEKPFSRQEILEIINKVKGSLFD
ncbi:MAG: response regulator [Fidelibacterota bacterium]